MVTGICFFLKQNSLFHWLSHYVWPKQYNIILFLRWYFPSLTTTSKGCYVCYLKVRYQYFTVHLPASERQKEVDGEIRVLSGAWAGRERAGQYVCDCTRMPDLRAKGRWAGLEQRPHIPILPSLAYCWTLLHFCHAYRRGKLHSLSSGEWQFLLLPILKESKSLEKVTVGRLQ